MNDIKKIVIFGTFGFLLGLIVTVSAFALHSNQVNNECEKELLRRDEPRGIVCVTKIQSIVTSNGDEQ
ncbi:MAG: hypothetical protein HRT69_18470 [Flavobacteriaceae bacterium]|nr:hypothetical protein [Colwellia sp.]NQY31437.1 hypothetical protein [Flavobacteriaceae bacterium]